MFVSIIGRFARVIQAHVCLEEQRLKVRYSQLFDFRDCSQHQMDLFLRWILSSPLVEPKLLVENDETQGTPFGDTAAQMVSETSSEATHLTPSECCEDNESVIPMDAISAAG